MAFDTLAPQTQVNAAAEAYSAECLRRGKLAAACTDYAADIPFASDPLQRVDVWRPLGIGPDHRLPVLLFFHGGNFTHGYKEWCGFMAPALAAFPAILVAAGYRLSPTAPYREIVGDGLAALRLVRRRIAGFGGDPNRIWLGGHSAGAQIAAEIALRHDRRAAAGLGDDAFVGVLPLSGNYHRRLGSLEPDPADRIPDDCPDSPVELASGARHPFLVAWGGDEKPYVHEGGADFVAALTRVGVPATQLVIPGQDHFAVHLGVAAAGSAWMGQLRTWMEGTPPA